MLQRVVSGLMGMKNIVVIEAHPLVTAYVKNQGLDFSVPYQYLGASHRYFPDFILRIGDGDLLNLVVEIKGYRGENAKDKKSTIQTCWIPGVNGLKSFGRWAFAEFGDVWRCRKTSRKKCGGGSRRWWRERSTNDQGLFCVRAISRNDTNHYPKV
jgi:hypothetical protein